jgi:hypothetical protein
VFEVTLRFRGPNDLGQTAGAAEVVRQHLLEDFGSSIEWLDATVFLEVGNAEEIVEEVSLEPVQSTNVAGVGYEPFARELHVRFASSPTVYVYSGVSDQKFEQLRVAESIGRFVNGVIKPHHPVRKIE